MLGRHCLHSPTQTLGVPGRAHMQTSHKSEPVPCPFQNPSSFETALDRLSSSPHFSRGK